MPSSISNRPTYRPFTPPQANRAARARRKPAVKAPQPTPAVASPRSIKPRPVPAPHVAPVPSPRNFLSRMAGYVAPALLIAGVACFCGGCLPAGLALVVIAFAWAIGRYLIRWPNSREAFHKAHPGEYW